MAPRAPPRPHPRTVRLDQGALVPRTGTQTQTSAELGRAALSLSQPPPRLGRRRLGRPCPEGGIRRSELTYAAATDGPPPSGEQRGLRVSERFQRSRVPVLPTVLFADASEDYRAMARDALLEGRNATDMRAVAGGAELLAYLQGGADNGSLAPRPSLIFVDAELPGEPGGFAAVRAIKADPSLKRIPVVALGSDDDPDT